MWPVVLLAAAGVLMGGAWSLRSQGANRFAIVTVAAFGVLAFVAGVLWMLPKGVFG